MFILVVHIKVSFKREQVKLHLKVVQVVNFICFSPQFYTKSELVTIHLEIYSKAKINPK